MLEQRARLGEALGLGQVRPAADQQSIYRRRADLHELEVVFQANLEHPRIVQVRQFDIHRSAQSFGANAIEQVGHHEQSSDFRVAVYGLAAGGARDAWHSCACLYIRHSTLTTQIALSTSIQLVYTIPGRAGVT
jgi:hypothetical protein